MKEQYNQRLDKIEALIDHWLPNEANKDWFSSVFPGGYSVNDKLTGSIITPPWDLLKRGGKRWRPLLMLLSAGAISGERGENFALDLVPLVEFPHNASLIHDDIEDNSTERRGKAAVHLIYGMDTAINAGSFMYFLPLACLSAWQGAKDHPELKERIWDIWGAHMRALHLGQAMDIVWHRDFYSLPEIDEYDRMCRLKTGCLASLAAVLGIHMGFALLEPSLIETGSAFNLDKTVRDFGQAAEQLGVGFQILDDVKNLTSGVPGKKRGDDIVEGKKSLPILLYLHRYPEKMDFVASCFSSARAGGTEAGEVEDLIASLEQAGVLGEAKNKGLEYINSCKETFSALSLDNSGRSLLLGLVDLLL